MFRNRFLSTSAYFLAISDEQKAANQKQRESIEVTKQPVAKETEQEEKEVETKEEGSEEEIETKEDKVEDKIEAKEDEIEDLEGEKEQAKTDKEKQRVQKRIDKLTAQKDALKAENETLKAQLAARPEDEKVFTEDEVNERAEKLAEIKAAQKEFKASVKRIAESCQKLDKDFSVKVNEMVEEVTGQGTYLPSVMVGLLDDLPDNGGNVLLYLAENTDEYEKIHDLSEGKMALKLKAISDKLNAKPKKEISKVPEPKDKLAGKGATPEVLNDKMPMQDWVKIRARQAEEHRKMKLGLH